MSTDDAAQERAAASAERLVASDERDRAADERRHSRVDIAALAVEVGHLGASVQDLHDLILDSMIKSEQASTLAERNPSRRMVFVLVGLSTLLAVVLAGGGVYTTRELARQAEAGRDTLRLNCETRNAAAEVDALFVLSLSDAAARAAERGDPFAAEVQALLEPRTRPILVDCTSYEDPS